MIKYLNRLKSKNGFTLVELLVVIAIIGLLITVLLVNMIGGNTEKILAANSNAQAFMSAAQLTLTKAQLTERSVVDYGSDNPFIEYKNGANTTNGKYLFIEVKFEQNGIVGLHIENTLNDLMARDDITSTNMTTLENFLATNVNEYLTESFDGYFYAVADDNFRVLFSHYCDYRLPRYAGNLTTFRNNMMISDGKVVGNSAIIGTCSDAYTVPTTGDYVFGLPDTTDANYSKYLA